MAANDKPAENIDNHERNLTQQVSDTAAGKLSDQAHTLLGDQRRSGNDRVSTAEMFQTASSDGVIAKSPQALAETHGQAFGNLPPEHQDTIYTTIKDYVAAATAANNPQLAAAMSQYEPALRQYTATA